MTVGKWKLGMIVALGQTFGSQIYCGDAWFNTGSTIGINFVVHCILVWYNHWTEKRKLKQESNDAVDDRLRIEVMFKCVRVSSHLKHENERSK